MNQQEVNKPEAKPSSLGEESETTLEALRRNEVDAIVSDNDVLLLRLHQVEKELRRSEERLRELNKTLEQRIDERTAVLEQQAHSLRNLANELIQAEQRERKRLARILHDGLQQILIAIEVNVILLPIEGDLEEKDEILQLVKEAIEVSRSLAYELVPPILYKSSFTEGLKWLARWFDEKHRFVVELVITGDLPPLVENAKVFLFNAVRELLLNSVKHSGVHEAVVKVVKVDENWWHIGVEDEGNGFDPAYLQEAAEIEQGFGLLSIRERLIALGGRLEINSSPAKGAHFLIKFPVSVAEAKTPTPRSAPAPVELSKHGLEEDALHTPELRVLMVDDHQVVREALASMLQRQTHFLVVGQAGDGLEAIKLVEQLHPDVVVMDINMPRMDGIEATRHIKEKYPATHIIGLSLFDEADKAEAMINAGADTYLPKDAATKTLIETLVKLEETKL